MNTTLKPLFRILTDWLLLGGQVFPAAMRRLGHFPIAFAVLAAFLIQLAAPAA